MSLCHYVYEIIMQEAMFPVSSGDTISILQKNNAVFDMFKLLFTI